MTPIVDDADFRTAAMSDRGGVTGLVAVGVQDKRWGAEEPVFRLAAPRTT